MDEPRIRELIGDDAEAILGWRPAAATAAPDRLVLPGPDWIERAWIVSDRSPAWLRGVQALFDAGRLGGSGHLSVLAAPRDEQDPVGLADLAIEGGCSAVLGSERLLGMVARTHAHRIPFVARTSPGAGPAEDVARRLRDGGAVGICVVVPGDPASNAAGVHALVAAAQAEGLFALVHTPPPAGPPREGLATIAASLGAAFAWQDIVALPVEPPGSTSPPARANNAKAAGVAIEALRQQHAKGWLGRVGLLGGTPDAARDGLRAGLRAAVFNKRAGGIGQVSGRAVAALPREQGVALLHAVQDVYLCGGITVAF